MNPAMMMDPEMMRIAQEQMSRMSPHEMSRIQQQIMSNPELLRMATESMKDMRPEDFRTAAEQLKHTRPEDMARIGERMANATPEGLASMRAQADQYLDYQLTGAQMLKQEGNKLHSNGKFEDAAQKYLLAKNNLKEFPVPKCRFLQLQCSVNLMSCYLKTKKFEECINEGSEVLAHDPNNVKALYRRGQAYKEIGNLEAAVSDLSKANGLSPEDETVADSLRHSKEKLIKERPQSISQGVIIEEIVEEKETSLISDDKRNSSALSSTGVANCSSSNCVPETRVLPTDAESLKEDPEAIRLFQNYISNANPDHLAAMGAADMSPDMLKQATNMISKMNPHELQKMLQIASSLKGQNFNIPGATSNGAGIPEMTPEMMNMASEKLKKMSPEELNKMFEFASSMNLNGSPFSTAASTSSTKKSQTNPLSSVTAETSFTGNTFSLDNNVQPQNPTLDPRYPKTSVDLQENMRNSMKDPAMRQMFTSMLQNMSPEMIANMGEQFGVKLSKDDAAKAQQAMSSLSPDALERMMRWADRAQRGVETARKTKNWLLGKPGMILAICILILAIVLNKLGYIGS